MADRFRRCTCPKCGAYWCASGTDGFMVYKHLCVVGEAVSDDTTITDGMVSFTISQQVLDFELPTAPPTT